MTEKIECYKTVLRLVQNKADVCKLYPSKFAYSPSGRRLGARRRIEALNRCPPPINVLDLVS